MRLSIYKTKRRHRSAGIRISHKVWKISFLKATSKDPFHRYDSVNEMKEDIMTALYPERANEERFSIPDDMEATKAIPIIRQEAFQESASDETIIMSGKWEEAKKEPESEPEEQPKKVKKKKKKRCGRFSLPWFYF
ncbi:hypothetical protein GCM10020331_047290 [Ectobacillus funiculus]